MGNSPSSNFNFCSEDLIWSSFLDNNVDGVRGDQGSILPGVTRQSIIELARARGYEVQEDLVSVNEAMVADEIFTSGTAVVVCSVGSLTFRV